MSLSSKLDFFWSTPKYSLGFLQHLLAHHLHANCQIYKIDQVCWISSERELGRSSNMEYWDQWNQAINWCSLIISVNNAQGEINGLHCSHKGKDPSKESREDPWEMYSLISQSGRIKFQEFQNGNESCPSYILMYQEYSLFWTKWNLPFPFNRGFDCIHNFFDCITNFWPNSVSWNESHSLNFGIAWTGHVYEPSCLH